MSFPQEPEKGFHGLCLAPREIYVTAKKRVKGFTYKEKLLRGVAGAVPRCLSWQGGQAAGMTAGPVPWKGTLTSSGMVFTQSKPPHGWPGWAAQRTGKMGSQLRPVGRYWVQTQIRNRSRAGGRRNQVFLV